MVLTAFAVVDRHQVLDALKETGSRDPDVLLATKQALLEPVRSLRIIGLVGYVIGGLATALVVGAVAGVPLILFAWWARRRGKRNTETIEAAFVEYRNSIAEAADSRS